MDPLTRLRHEIHLESARIAPQTSGLIEAAREYIEYVDALLAQRIEQPPSKRQVDGSNPSERAT